jgi:hypothetical protein
MTYLNFSVEQVKVFNDVLKRLAKEIGEYGPITNIKVYDSKETMDDGTTGFDPNKVQAKITYG